jgi:hypothetical protein
LAELGVRPPGVGTVVATECLGAVVVLVVVGVEVVLADVAVGERVVVTLTVDPRLT